MNSGVVKHIVRFVLLILLQVLVLDTVQFGGYIIPYVFLLFVLLLPLDINKTVLLLLAFFTGLTVDYFENTLGLQAAAVVFMAYARPGVIRFYFSGTEFPKGEEPGISVFGAWGFLKYVFTLALFHQFALTLLEEFSFHNFMQTITEVFLNTLATTLAIFVTVLLFTRRKKRRRI
jgi:cell shape-determining protein MreD